MNDQSGRNTKQYDDLPICCKAEIRVTSESSEDFDSFMRPITAVTKQGE